jgi:hypothetical protein
MLQGLSLSAAGLAPGRWSTTGVVVGLGSLVTKSVIDFVKSSEADSLHPIEGCMHTLHAILLREETLAECGLRICLHRPDKDREAKELIQVTEYVGSPVRGNVHRRLPVYCGLAGHAFRNPGQLHVQNRL